MHKETRQMRPLQVTRQEETKQVKEEMHLDHSDN